MKVRFDFLSMIASILALLGFAYLTYEVHIKRQTEHLLYITLFLILSSQILLFINGLINAAVQVYIPAIIIIVCISYVLYIKFNNEIIIY